MKILGFLLKNKYIRKLLKLSIFNGLRHRYFKHLKRKIITRDLLKISRNKEKALNLKDEQIIASLMSGIKTIADVGCEGSKITAYLGLCGYRVTGVDSDTKIINYVKKLIKKNKYKFKIDFKIANIYRLPFRDNEFDCVICSEVIEHLRKPKRAIRELFRIAKKQAIITVPVLYSFNSSEHIQHFDDKDIKELLKDYNFKYKKIITKEEDIRLGQKLFLITIDKVSI